MEEDTTEEEMTGKENSLRRSERRKRFWTRKGKMIINII